MQTKLKNVLNGKNLEKRFRSADRVEKASLEEKNMQYLYEEPDGLIFMDSETFEQITLAKDLIGESSQFLVEGETYPVSHHGETPLGITLPNTVNLKVTYAPPEVKKATASSSLRPVTVENDMTIQAPVFIKEGDVIKVNVETSEYVERVKE